MPIFIAALWGAFLNVVGTVAGRVLVSLGIGLVTYKGISTTLTWLKTQAVSALQGLPADALSLVAYMGVGEFVSIISSALVMRMVLNGLTGDTFKRWATK